MIRRLFALLLLVCAPLAAAPAPARTVELSGQARNTTAGLAAPMQLTLVITGEKVTTRLRTAAPLTGTGELTGRFVGGWCELEGRLDGGLLVRFRGVLNAQNLRGLYLATVPNTPLQYGKFNLAIQPAAATAKP